MDYRVRLFQYSNKDLTDYFNLENEFKYMEELDYYVKDKKLLEIIKKNSLISNFT